MKKTLLVCILVLAGCGALSQAFTPTTSDGKTPAEKTIGPYGDMAGATGTPWGILAMALFGSGGAVFTIGKTINRILNEKKAKVKTA